MGTADDIAIFEWGASGILHTHGFQWDAKHVRTDNIFEDDDSDMSEGDMEAARDAAYQDLVEYGANCISDFHPGERHAVNMGRIGLKLEEHPCEMPVRTYMNLVEGISEELVNAIEDMIETVEMHDNHLPDPAGQPM